MRTKQSNSIIVRTIAVMICLIYLIWLISDASPIVSAADSGVHDAYSMTGQLIRSEQLKAEIQVEKLAVYNGEAYLVVELMKGHSPILINAIPIKQDTMNISQYFNVSGSEYSVKVFLFNQFDGELDIPVSLARSITLQ